MNPIHLLATAAADADASSAGLWLILGFFALVIGIAAVAEWRGRAWRKYYLEQLFIERDAVAFFLAEHFDRLDADGDGLITIPDLDDAIDSGKLDVIQSRMALMLRESIRTVGHLAKSEYILVAMPSCGFGMVQGVDVDTYAIGRKDIAYIASRLDAALRQTSR